MATLLLNRGVVLLHVCLLLLTFLLLSSEQSNATTTSSSFPLYTNRKQVVVFLTVTDSSHIRDFQMLAKAYSIISNIGSENIHFVSLVKDFEIESDGRFNIVECSPPGDAFRQSMESVSVFSNSGIPKLGRFNSTFTMISKAYELGVGISKDLFAIKSENCDMSFGETLKESREGKVRLLIIVDVLLSGIIEWAHFEGIEFVVINTPPVVSVPSNSPAFLPQLVLGETSLTRGRSILQREGVLTYLKHQFKEQVLEWIEMVKVAYPIMGAMNKLREQYGFPAVNGPFFELKDRVTIHFTIPGIFEYSYPIPQVNKFVGFNHIEKSQSTRQTVHDKSGSGGSSVGEDVQDEMEWLDLLHEKKEKVVLIAFGTKVKISLDHSRKMVQAIMKSDTSLNILFATSSFENKEQLFDDPSMSNKDWERKILIKKWVKQVDVLRHATVSLFVSHAGAHSLFESIDAKVPLLLFPLFGDQYLNSVRADDVGIGRTIHDLDNQEELVRDIHYLLDNSQEIGQRMERIKLINKEVSALSANTEILQRLLESNATSTLSSASLAAATIIRQVALFGSEQFVDTEHQLLFTIEKLNIFQLFITISLLLICCPILAIIYQCKKKPTIIKKHL